jgi:hypothetical protein
MAVAAPSAAGLALSTKLSRYYVKNFIAPHRIARILNKNNVPYVLVGAHGINTWLEEPRATQDVDVIVGFRHDKKAVRLLLEAFPQLAAEDHEVVTRLRDPESGKVVIDVMKAVQPHLRVASKHTVTIQLSRTPIPIPTLEMALVLKFAPMISLVHEDGKKLRDAADFVLMVQHNKEIDLETLQELGNLVYPGGGKEIVEKVRQVRAGERLQL